MDLLGLAVFNEALLWEVRMDFHLVDDGVNSGCLEKALELWAGEVRDPYFVS
jgi:hypothetical protein